jgi:hypothetical protein
VEREAKTRRKSEFTDVNQNFKPVFTNCRRSRQQRIGELSSYAEILAGLFEPCNTTVTHKQHGCGKQGDAKGAFKRCKKYINAQ